MNNVTVVGSGYVGMANATMLAKYNKVTILDIDHDRVDQVNNNESPISDAGIEDYLQNEVLTLSATIHAQEAYRDAEWVIIATPTDYCELKNYFNTDSIQSVLHDIIIWRKENLPNIVIKSTIPVGFVEEMRERFMTENIFFSPEFLREGSALDDCLNPDRIVVGDKTREAEDYVTMIQGALQLGGTDAPVIYMGPTEAEAVKLFANSYLAMRVAYFNELDTYAEFMNLDSQEIIKGVCEDKRIGHFYNNPSFGYGGYCFPKDTKQLLANFRENRIPNRLVSSIVYSNDIRMDWIANQILHKSPSVVGIHRLIMKTGSDNYRSSAIQGIITRLTPHVKVIIHEPEFSFGGEFMDCIVETDIKKFKKLSDVIITNRMEDSLLDVVDKVYSRDVFNDN